jgi:hypothetical protein
VAEGVVSYTESPEVLASRTELIIHANLKKARELTGGVACLQHSVTVTFFSIDIIS